MEDKSKKGKQEEERVTKDQFTVVLKQINSKMDLLADGHKSLNQKIEHLDKKFESFKSDTESNFRSVADYLARIEAEIHGELKTKADVKELGSLEKRVERLEYNWRLQCLSRTKS